MEAKEGAEGERAAPERLEMEERPEEKWPEEKWIRGACPWCGDVLVSVPSYIGGRGYLLVWKCWRDCGYRRVL